MLSVTLSSVPEIFFFFFFFFFLALNSFMVKLDKRHTKTKKAPWITMKERFIASPSKRPPPEDCPKAFLTSDSTAANACVNNDCGNINSATQKLLQSSEPTILEVGANEDVGEDNDEEDYFSDEEIDEQVTSNGEESEPLDESLFQ